MYSLWERIKSGIYEVVKSRTFVVIIVFSIMSAILLQRVFYLQIVKGQDYADEYALQIQKTREVQGTRGNIYDRNGTLLAYNELAYSVTFEDPGEYDSVAEKNRELNQIVSTVIRIVEANGNSVINDFGIILDNDNNYAFVAQNNTQRLRFIADVYGQSSIDKLSDKQKDSTAADVIDYLCTHEVYGYGLNQAEMDKTEILKLVNIRYAISLNRFTKYITTTIAEDVSDETVAAIMEHLDTLPGVDIEEASLRRYTDSQCFASIVGYTGQISQEEYDALSKEEQKEYALTDTVGKAGLEQTLDSQLQGTKGEVKLYVNSDGKVLDTEKNSDPTAGNDVTLTIDANLQKAAYHIIEQELAGIVLAKMQDTLDYDRTQVSDGSDVIIPVGDAYNAFIGNDILDMNHFDNEEAQATEKEVYGNFSARKETVLNEISLVLQDPNAQAYQDMSKEMQAYLTYIVTDILTTNTGIIMSDAVDTGDSTYKAWKEDETINVYTYLNYAISQNWVDSSLLKDFVASGGDYSDSGELYQAMTAFVLDYIGSNNGFDKLIYRYMIREGSVTGRQICMMLYEQGILPFDEDQYNRLNSGQLGAYDFLRGKIQDLAITPGQLALEPCTGSLVMTDTNTGEVRACVSYPGYDNNRLANTMDSDYYNKLVTGLSRPFYNNATQEKTAPGSTYKPLVAVAGLTENVIDLDTYLECSGVYEKVTPSPRCWIYPEGHGGLNVEGGIENSCNCFFYEVGYRLSTRSSENYSSQEGLDGLRKYAEEFGLNETSGLEIPESDPQISDDSSVPSAIGQGTNNYTTSQLARYITAVANKGTVFDLTLLDKVTDLNGKTIQKYETSVKNQMTDVSDSTWNAIHNGMRGVILNHAAFSEVNTTGIDISGKTGTAQQSTTHPDHALFVGFAPSENPEVAFAIRIANGYSSTYAAEVGRDVMKYYYQIAPEDQIITGTAATIGKAATGGD